MSDTALTPRRPSPRVSAIVLNYGATVGDLARCVASLAASVGVGPGGQATLAEILIADNASPVNGEAPDEVAARCTTPAVPVKVVRFDRNHGFAGGINRSIDRCETTSNLIFLLNNDATVAPDCIAECARVLMTHTPDVLGVAPKMLLAGYPDHLDSVGMAVNGAGEAFNRGLGQPDIGQYDTSEPTFGPCFGAALLRRNAFADAHVGPLDSSFFLYYEDVDWNWRASLLGYRFFTAPTARVWHAMSASTRHLDYGFKFRLIERNLLTTVARNFGARRAVGIWARRGAGLLKGGLSGRHYPSASLQAVTGAVARLPRTLVERQALQRRRRRSDETLIAFSDGEATFYDAVAYQPTQPDRARLAALARLAATAPPRSEQL